MSGSVENKTFHFQVTQDDRLVESEENNLFAFNGKNVPFTELDMDEIQAHVAIRTFEESLCSIAEEQKKRMFMAILFVHTSPTNSSAVGISVHAAQKVLASKMEQNVTLVYNNVDAIEKVHKRYPTLALSFYYGYYASKKMPVRNSLAHDKMKVKVSKRGIALADKMQTFVQHCDYCKEIFVDWRMNNGTMSGITTMNLPVEGVFTKEEIKTIVQDEHNKPLPFNEWRTFTDSEGSYIIGTRDNCFVHFYNNKDVYLGSENWTTLYTGLIKELFMDNWVDAYIDVYTMYYNIDEDIWYILITEYGSNRFKRDTSSSPTLAMFQMIGAGSTSSTRTSPVCHKNIVSLVSIDDTIPFSGKNITDVVSTSDGFAIYSTDEQNYLLTYDGDICA